MFGMWCCCLKVSTDWNSADRSGAVNVITQKFAEFKNNNKGVLFLIRPGSSDG